MHSFLDRSEIGILHSLFEIPIYPSMFAAIRPYNCAILMNIINCDRLYGKLMSIECIYFVNIRIGIGVGFDFLSSYLSLETFAKDRLLAVCI